MGFKNNTSSLSQWKPTHFRNMKFWDDSFRHVLFYISYFRVQKVEVIIESRVTRVSRDFLACKN